MSVTPSVSTPVMPGLLGAATGADAASEISVASAGLFAQLMAALVPPAAPAAAGPAEQPTEGKASDAAVTTVAPGPATLSTDPTPCATTGLPTGSVPGRRAPAGVATAAAPDSGAAPDPTTEAATRPTTEASATPLPGAAATLDPTAGKPRPAASPETHPAAHPAASPVAPTGAPLPEPTPAGSSLGTSTEPPAAAAGATPTGSPGPTPGPASAVAPTGVPTPTNQPASTAAPAPLPVSRQVIPELTRMSTLGEGVHRLTMTLRPEALGEVRVTMTVRDGSLHVRLAAGTEAQHALVPDLTELQQVLKLGSGSDVRVVLRDLSGVPANPDQQSTQTGNQNGNQAGNQTGGQQGAGQHAGHGAPTGDPGTSAGSGQNRREAGTPRDINATDGVVDGTSGSRSQAVRRARPTGVDLTM